MENEHLINYLSKNDVKKEMHAQNCMQMRKIKKGCREVKNITNWKFTKFRQSCPKAKDEGQGMHPFETILSMGISAEKTYSISMQNPIRCLPFIPILVTMEEVLKWRTLFI